MKKNAEAEVSKNPIAGLFVRKAPKIRVDRPKTEKRKRGSVKKQGNFTSEAPSKSKSFKSNTTGKFNISTGDGVKNNEEDKKKQMKWILEYFHKLQV